MGHFGGAQVKMATMTLGMVSMELERQKMQPVVNTEAYLDGLNKYVYLHSSPSLSINSFLSWTAFIA